MDTPFDVVALVGSLRRESFTRHLAEALIPLAPPSLRFEIVPIGELSLYNQDDEAAPPEPWQRFRQRIRRCDAVLFATAEYNRSIPACLKNAVDVGSRPYAANVWAGKPAAVASMSPGALAGLGAHHHLRQCLVAVGMATMAQPEACFGHVDRMVAASGEFADGGQREYCAGFVRAFAEWIHRNPSHRP